MIGAQIKRLVSQTAVYGLGGIVARLLALFMLPLYTTYLGTSGFGKIETIVALTTVLVVVLRLGISSAFFRFYFDSADPDRRRLVVRTSFWFTMTMATAGLVAGCILATPLAHELKLGNDPWLVRAGFVGLWAQMNYEQLTSLFRVEERPVAFVSASIANILITVGTTVLLVVALDKGPIGAVVGNFTGTLVVYFVLLGYRRYQLGLEFDRGLLREMNRFGLPLVPSALALWAISFIDRFFVAVYKGQSEVGVYSLAMRAASVIIFLMVAFRLAWPAFAYSIEDESTAKRTYAFVLTYLLLVCCWASLALGLLSPWIVRVLAPRNEAFWRASEAVGLHGPRDRHRPRAAHAVQLDRHRSRRAAQHRAQLRAHPAVRDDGRRHLHRRRVPRDVRRDDAERAARVAGAVPVASSADALPRRDRAARDRQGGRRVAAARDRSLPRLPGRAPAAALLPPRRAPPPAPQLSVRS
jgi:Na+-driven multidrug efflux pump